MLCETRHGSFLIGTVLTIVAACAPGGAARSIRPTDPTVGSAMNPSGACHVVADFGQPLVVDWEAHERSNLEEAMHDGLAVVAYDCHTLRLLRGCRIDGTYGFLGTSKKEEVIQLEDADEIRANLPTFGGKLALDLQADLARSATLDVALVLVGKKRTTWKQAARSDLVGSCDGATHFVRGAFVGAFAVATGTRGRVRSAIDVFGAGASGASTSSKRATHTDGDLNVCKQVHGGAATAPNDCDALVRLELIAVKDAPKVVVAEGKGKTASDVEGPTCGAGLVLRAGKCAAPSAAAPHTCAPTDVADCATQCEHGDAKSCSFLGFLYHYARGVPKDAARASSLYQKACDGGDLNGCAGLGVIYLYAQGGVAQDEARALSLFKRACDGGDARGCNNLGNMYEDGLGGLPKDQPLANALFKQACDGGWARACCNLGLNYSNDTHGLTKDEVRATALFKQACDGGEAQGCYFLGGRYDRGEGGVAKDQARANVLYKLACDGGDPGGCGNLGSSYRFGWGGLAKDEARAVALYRRSCDDDNMLSCSNLGEMYEAGTGVTRDVAEARRLYKKACDKDGYFGCSNLKNLKP